MSAAPQPSGEVTLVFSDIEGSTKLLEDLGTDAYGEALREHRRIVREAYGRYSGYEVDYEGDAFFYAFGSAADAISAVSHAMDGLAGGPVAIRVGIHTGTPALDPPKYVGMDVHFAARVMSTAHGGQVVVSKTTADLVEASLVELGEHRLKDIADAVPLYQLGDGTFPPLKTISNTNLPRPASSFVGRERELEEVLSRVETGARLVTLTGPGGTGKTRLALEAASSLVGSYKAGVFWVGLASLRDPALVEETIAQTLGAKDGLADHIGERELLLLLDNLEQVIDAARDLSALLSACPNLTLLVTSRELLRIGGEVEYAVPPLAEAEAVSLFCERSQLEPSDEIAELCARLDSLPLAVELAAARCKALSPAQILERLSGRLDLLEGGRDSDPRQQTLRATIEWSYELLSEREQGLFARLSVFAGGCTLEAAEEIAKADVVTLQSLIEKSLLRLTPSASGGRYWMLETIRAFAAELLDANDPVRDRHVDYFTGLVDCAREAGSSPNAEWVDRLEREQHNLRAVFDRLAKRRDAARLLDVLGFVLQVWWLRGERRAGLQICQEALALDGDLMTEGRARTLKLAGLFAVTMGDTDAGIDYTHESLSVFRALDHAEQLSAVLINLGAMSTQAGRNEDAMRFLQEAIVQAERAGIPNRAAVARDNMAGLALLDGDYETAVVVGRDVVATLRAGGDDASLTMPLFNLAFACFRSGRFDEMAQAARECLNVAHRLGDMRVLADVLLLSAAWAARAGEAEAGARLLGAAEGIAERVGLGSIGGLAEAALYEDTSESLRSDLRGRYAAVIADGRGSSVDGAVCLARASLD